MEAAHLLAFNAALLAALASPGPAMLYALRTTLAEGRAAGMAVGIGLGTAAAGWTAAALAGLDAVLLLFPTAFAMFKLAGAAYLIWVAIGIWRSARAPVAAEARPTRSPRRAVLAGLGINLANPKSVLFAAAVLVVIFPPGLSLAEKATIVANHMIVEWIAYALFALLLSSPPARAGYLGAKPVLDRAAGLVLGALGLRLVLDR